MMKRRSIVFLAVLALSTLACAMFGVQTGGQVVITAAANPGLPGGGMPPPATPGGPTLPPPQVATVVPDDLPGDPIAGANAPGEWLLYNSPSAINVLLADGAYVWAGSRGGGLVQWNPQTLEAIRHTPANGFPHNTVNDIDYDRESGLVYVVGDGGLSVWDGVAWSHHTQAELGFEPDLPLVAVAVESGSVIWVAGKQWLEYVPFSGEIESVRGGGLARGDWLLGEWTHFDKDSGLLDNQVNDLAVAPDGSLWVTTGQYGNEPTEGGVSRRDVDGTWTHHRLEDGFGLDGYAFGPLAIGPDGTVYAGSRRGVSILAYGAGEWVSHNMWDVAALYVDSRGRLWLTGRGGVWKLEPGAPALDPVYATEDVRFTAVTQDHQGDVWFGSLEAGLFELAESQFKPRPVLGALPGNVVHSVAVNGDGSLWVRTSNGSYWDAFGGEISQIVDDRIIHFSDQFLAVEAAWPWTGEQSIWPVSPEGQVWVLDSGAFWGYDGSEWARVEAAEAGEYIGAFAVGPGEMIVAVGDSGSHLYRPDSGWQVLTSSQETPGFYNVANLLVAADGTIWGSGGIGYLNSGGVFRYDFEAGTWVIYDQGDGDHQSPAVFGLLEANDGTIWSANFNGELLYYDAASDGWVVAAAPEMASESAGFSEMYPGVGDDLWLVTMDHCGFEGTCVTGLAHYAGGEWTFYTASDSPLVSDWVLDVAPVDATNVWVATNAGLQLVTVEE